MLQRFILFVAAILMSFGAAACKKPEPEAPAIKQARFQAAQRTRAIQSYEKLVKDYPESPYAPQAEERLRILKAQDAAKKQ